jgi:hypothetical protein
LFVDYAVEVPLPEQRVIELLVTHGAEMQGMGAAAYRRGEELRSKVGPGGPIAKEVVVALDRPIMYRRGAVVPIRWRAAGAEALFPRLEGELAVEGNDDETSILHLQANYKPPLGSIGTLMDRLVLTRIARATVSDWVDRIADWTKTAAVSLDGLDGLDGKDYLHDGAGADHGAD